MVEFNHKIILVFLYLVVSFIQISICQAMESTGIKAIRPVPAFSKDSVQLSKFINEYFDYVGTLDFKFDNRLVINDQNFELVDYTDLTNINEGNYIGIKINDAGKIVQVEKLKNLQ